jgi:hypothetical protein
MDPTPDRITGGFVAGDTRIALMDGHTCTIADVVDQLHRGVHRTTYALQADGNVHAVQVHYARRAEGDSPVLGIHLDDGALIHCAAHQLFLAPDGEWVRAQDLSAGHRLLTVVEPHLWVGKEYDTDLHARTDAHRSVVEITKDGERALYEFQVDHLHNVAHPSGVFLHD